MATPAFAQAFSIDWFTIEAGGATQGDPFELVSVIGQPDAGPAMTRGQFSLLGGFLAGLDAPPFCPADFNRDGTVDFFDYLDFVSAFADEDPTADFNGDAIVDFFDYLDFAQAFGAGC